MKFLMLLLSIFVFNACSTTSLKHAWYNTKRATYNATKDPVTWVSLLTAGVLYSTNYDNDITNYLMEKEPVDSDNDDRYRDINSYETFLTALFIEDDEYKTKAKRVLVQSIAFQVGREASDALNMIDKTSPDGINTYALGSQHAIGPFLGSAMTRRNVDQLNIPTWGKYTLNTISYMTARASTITRIQEAGHSFADQLVSVSVGNFIGIFFHDAFMLDDNTNIIASFNNDSTNIRLTYRY